MKLIGGFNIGGISVINKPSLVVLIYANCLSTLVLKVESFVKRSQKIRAPKTVKKSRYRRSRGVAGLVT